MHSQAYPKYATKIVSGKCQLCTTEGKLKYLLCSYAPENILILLHLLILTPHFLYMKRYNVHITKSVWLLLLLMMMMLLKKSPQ